MGKKSPSTPPPPPPVETPDFISEISGVRRRVVKDASGRETIIEERLPLTPEEQAAADKLTELQESNLARIEELSGFTSALDIPEFQDTIEAFRSQQLRSFEDTAELVTTTQEEALARRGLSESSAGIGVRTAREAEFRQELRGIDESTRLAAEGLRQEGISRAQNLFGIATGREDVLYSRFAESLGRGQSGALAQQQIMGQQQQQQWQNQLAIAQMKQKAALGTAKLVGTLAGAAIGGPIGASIGGSLFGGGAGEAGAPNVDVGASKFSSSRTFGF